jgi:hypothetical protein
MRRKRSSVSRTSATTAHSSMSLSAASFRASSRCVGRAGRRGRSSRNRTLAGRFRPRSGSVYQSRNPCCARTPAAPSAQYTATVQAHDRRSIAWSRRTASGTAIPCLPATIQRRAEELFFLRVFLGLGAEAGAGRNVGRWPNGRAGVARDRGCAAGRSGRWASPIRSAIGW